MHSYHSIGVKVSKNGEYVEIAENSWVIPATGHKWKYSSKTNNADGSLTVIFACENDGCNETYSVTFTPKQIEDISKIQGVTSKWEWAEDYSTATFTINPIPKTMAALLAYQLGIDQNIALYFAENGITVPATITTESIPPTCNEDGSITYTAHVNSLTDVKNVAIPMLKKTEITINSIDINGIITPTTVYAETYTSADYTVPSAPYMDGYNFTGWKVNNTLYTTAEAVQTAVADLVATKPETAIKVAVVYEKKSDKFGVNVTNGKLSDDKTSDTIQVSTLVNVTADTINGQKFSHWTINGVTVSYNASYSFYMPSSDVELEAVFVDNASVVEKVGTGYIESVKRTATNKLSFVSILSVPDGCQMQKVGLIVQSTDELNGAELTKNNAKLIKFSDTSKNKYSSFKYTWTMSTSNYTKKWTIRPYLEYIDKNGETQVIYGDAVSKCVNDVEM